jgi:hypothetical protein
MNDIEKLVEKIKSTNNGYLFAPTMNEIDLARSFDSIFLVTHKPTSPYFPWKISLK